MTLVVFKNGVLAADSRSGTTLRSPTTANACCPKCEERIDKVVKDEKVKIRLLNNKNYKFRGDIIRAYAAAGNVPQIDRFNDLIDAGKDIDESFEVFKLLYTGSDAVVVSLILVGTDHLWTIRFSLGSRRANMEVTKTNFQPYVSIGSGGTGASWINHFAGGSITAQEVVMLVKQNEHTVGGSIHYVNFNVEEANAYTIRTFDESTSPYTLENIYDALAGIRNVKTPSKPKKPKE